MAITSSGEGSITPASKGTPNRGRSSGGYKTRMTSDPRFRQFISARASSLSQRAGVPLSQTPLYRRYPLVMRRPEEVEAPEPRQKFERPGVELPIVRKNWNQPSPSNPFGEPTDKTPPREDKPMPRITPEIRAMAAPNATFMDMDKVTPDYIREVSRQDNDLAKRLAWNYMDEYSRRLINGYVTNPLDNATIDELNKLGERTTFEDFAKGTGGVVGGILNTIGEVTHAPVKVGAYATLEQGFRYQPKTIDPRTVGLSQIDSINVANVDLDKLPAYYASQLASGLSQNYTKDLERSLSPDMMGSLRPDPDPNRDKIYQSIVDKVFQQRQDWDYYADFSTAADGINTLFSAPGIRMAEARGESAEQHEQNILGTGNIAGLTSFARVTQMVKALKDAGVVIDKEDRYTMRTGWSAETVNKYAARLAANGQSLSDLVMEQGMDWTELKRALDLMNYPAENQADIARSLGFEVDDHGGEAKPIFVTRYNDYGVAQEEEVGREYQFDVKNPDMVVTLDDLRTKADAGFVKGEQLAALIGQKYTYAYFADVKTVPFQDLAASLVFDPTNYGKLQLVWEPLGLLFKGGGKLAKQVGKGMYYSGALMGDVGVGALKTVENLVGKIRGVESKILKPEDWMSVTNAAHYIVSESAQSVTNKAANRAFFVTKSIISPEYTKDGEGVLRWIDEVLPRLQESARSGDWTPFVSEVPAGAGDYAAQGLNTISNDLRRIATDEDAFGRFADNATKMFGEQIGEPDIAELRKLVSDGNYAGLTRWLADKHIAQRVLDNIDPSEARLSLDASDLINHITSSYRSGVGVLSEKSLGVFGKEVASPAVMRVNDMLSTASRWWTNAVLTARPGWNIINYLDNNARLIANGYNPSADVQDLERVLSDSGVTSTQLREIIYGGNFMDEAVRLNVPRTPQMAEASKFARNITVDSDPAQLAKMAELAQKASDSLKDMPLEARKQMEDVVNRLRVEADKLVKNKGSVKSLRAAADKVDALANQMYGKSATLDTKLFKSRLATLKEYGNILKSGDGNAIARIWNNWVELGHAVHRDIEAAARMRAFAPTFIDKYHAALAKLDRSLPKLPSEQEIAGRFAHIVDPQQKSEAIREATEAYAQLQQRLNGLVNEGALHPSKLPELQQYLDDIAQNPRSAARNFIYSTQPLVDGNMTPAADILMQKVGDWMTDVSDGMTHADLNNPARAHEMIDAMLRRANNRLKVEGAEANFMARTDQVIRPTSRVPDSVVNWMQDGQVTNPRDIAVTVNRMEKMQRDVEQSIDEFRNTYLELNHEPYLNTLDRVQRQLPNRAHRYDLMRGSFAEKFVGDATYNGEAVRVVGGTMDKGRGVVAILEDGRTVPVDAIQIEDTQRNWYLQQYSKWEKTKPGGQNLLTSSGIGSQTGSGVKMRRPAYAESGTPGMVPPDVARAYTKRLEDDVIAHGGALPTEYVDADGVKHMLAYETPEDFINRFGTPGSGLGFYKPSGGGENLIDGIQRTADNWTHLAKLADAGSLDDLSNVYIDGKKLIETFSGKEDYLQEIKQQIFSEKRQKISVIYERNGVKVNLSNDPKRGETLTDVTRRLWRDKIEGVYIETRGQWVPVFNPNAPAGSRITFQRLGTEDAVESLRVPVETGTAIPDEMGEKLLEIQETTEPVEQLGIQAEAAMHRLDNMLGAQADLPDFKPDYRLGGVNVMSTGKNRRLPEGGIGIEVQYPNGKIGIARFSELEPYKMEGTAAEMVAGSPEQLAAEAGIKTPEQLATIAASDPRAEFMHRHPRIENREQLLERGALLREMGSPVEDDWLSNMADVLEAYSVVGLKQDPDFLLKRVNLTALAPDGGLYQQVKNPDVLLPSQRIAAEMPEELRPGYYLPPSAYNTEELARQVDELTSEAAKYPAAKGLTTAEGVPLFQAPEGEALGAFKMIFDKNGPFGMIHFGRGATPETVAHEFSHFIQAVAELPEQFFDGPELAGFRKGLRDQLDVVLEAAGAPRLQYAERGPKQYRYVSYQNLYKVDREASNLVDEGKWAAFVEQSRRSNEQFAKWFTDYLATGKAPTSKLQEVFSRFKDWLSGVFLARKQRGERIPVEVKRVFDQWLADKPEWTQQMTHRGRYVFNKSNTDLMKQAMEATGHLGEWEKAIDTLRVAYGDWNDSDAILKFHETAKKTLRDLKAFASDKPLEAAENYLDTEAGNTLSSYVDDIRNQLDILDQIESGQYLIPSGPGMRELAEATAAGEKVAKTKMVQPTAFQKLTAKSKAEDEIASIIEDAKRIGVSLPDEVEPRDAARLIETYIDEQVKAFKVAGEGHNIISKAIDDFWNAYTELLQDGKFHPKKLVDGQWVYPEGAGPLTVEGKLHAGQYSPANPEHWRGIDEILAQERAAPASLDELAALNMPNSTYVSPELLEIMKYHAGVKTYLDRWQAAMHAAVDGGFLPGNTLRGLNPDDVALAQKWLSDKYSQITQAASKAQALAEEKTRLVMMDFETTYNLDRLMQQGPALPAWTGSLAGLRPLRVGGIVPFFKFPRENIESWINTLGNHPALIHNVARYQEQANIERKRFNLPEQFLPAWPVEVGGKVMSISPFAFISLGQMIRPFSPYIDEDATKVDQAVGVAGQMGFSLGPTLRAALKLTGLSEEQQPLIPQTQAFIPPALYQNIPDDLKWTLGLINKRDEFYINRQIVFDALADLSAVQSEGAKRRIIEDLRNAIGSRTHPRRMAAADHYYTMRFQTSNTGYWTGVYPREVSPGELDMKQYKTDLSQLRSAMVGAGLSPDQVDQIESYIAGDPRAEANRKLNELYNADASKALSNTDTEAWGNTVELSGKRSEYYEKRALIEADFQQKYGFSGTTMTDVDRENYNKQIAALNQEYADVLAPKKLVKQEWQTNEDYQREVSSMWLEYLNGTRPQFTSFKTYAEYQTAVDQWEKNLPKVSRQLWSTLQAPLSGLSTRNISELPGYLDAVSNKAAIDKFRARYDTVGEAIYSTLRDNYYSGYYDAVGGLVGPARLLAEMEYEQRHPVPDEAAVQKWIDSGLYQGRFSKQEILRELRAHPVADIRNSLLSGKTLPERQAFEIGELLARIPPGTAYFNFIESLPKDMQKYLSAYQVDSYTAFKSPDKWRTFYDEIVPRLKSEFGTPSLSEVREWTEAVRENDTMQAQRERMFPGIGKALEDYNAIDRADVTVRKQYRQQHPNIGKYYDWLYNDWQNSHPLWLKYYGSGESTPTSRGTSARSTQYVSNSGRPYRAGGGGRRYGGGGSYYGGTASASAAQAQWQGFRSMAGTSLYNALTAHWDNGTTLGESELTLLQALYKQYSFGAKDFNDWLENVLPKLRSAMIPGTSIFDSKARNQTQYQPQTGFGYYWFGRGKNAG